MNAPCIRRMPPRRLPAPRSLLRLALCGLCGSLLTLLLLLALLFLGLRQPLQLLLAAGQPLGDLLLWLLPETLWQSVTGMQDAAHHPALRSLLGLGGSIGLGGVLTGSLLYRLWYHTGETR